MRANFQPTSALATTILNERANLSTMLSIEKLNSMAKSNNGNNGKAKKKKFIPLNPRCPLYQEYIRKVKLGCKDLKLLVSSENSSLGVGKSTAALWLAMSLDENFHPDTHCCYDLVDYVNKYLELPRGSVLIYDESYFGLDARRSQSWSNVYLSRIWASMRVKGIVSIVISPSLGFLDKRVKELSNYRIHCLEDPIGKAIVSKIYVSRYDGTIWEEDLFILDFQDLSWHPYKRMMDEKKEQLLRNLRDEIKEFFASKDSKREMPKFKPSDELSKAILEACGDIAQELDDDHLIVPAGELCRKVSEKIEGLNSAKIGRVASKLFGSSSKAIRMNGEVKRAYIVSKDLIDHPAFEDQR